MINEYFLFFMDNKSGWKTQEKQLSKKEPEIYSNICEFSKKNSLNELPFKQKVWHFIHDYPSIPKCEECRVDLTFKRSLKEGYGKYCSLSCTNKNKERIEKIKKTNQLRYGGDSPSSSSDVKEKIKSTNLERYGFDNPFKNKKLICDSLIKHYGVDHPTKIEGVKDQIKKTLNERYSVNGNFGNSETYNKGLDVKYEKFLNRFPKTFFESYTGNTLSIKCDICGGSFSINRSLFRHRHLNNIIPCTICNPINSPNSFKEKEILSFVSSIYRDTIVENDRSLINPKEIDIYLPNQKIAIEFNGLFWHSSDRVNNTYHINKTNNCKLKDVNLIHIFEDEWEFKKDIVKSIIKSRLHIHDVIVYGRKCIVKEISSREYREFVDNNHIQGHVNSSIKIGLYYNEELVSVMSFGSLRKALGSKKENGHYEMLRFCNKLNYLVVGGASKLFKYFIKKYNPLKVTSFSDIRYFTGDLYSKLGFNYVSTTRPNYYYITDYLKRENRFKFRKDILVSQGFDPKKSESQIMRDRGIPKIYDCGNKKWIWKRV